MKSLTESLKGLSDAIDSLRYAVHSFGKMFKAPIPKNTRVFGVNYQTFKRIKNSEIHAIIVQNVLFKNSDKSPFLEFRCGDNVVYKKIDCYDRIATMSINGKHHLSCPVLAWPTALGFLSMEGVADAVGRDFRGGYLLRFKPIPKDELK